jgi:hypothetical protein
MDLLLYTGTMVHWYVQECKLLMARLNTSMKRADDSPRNRPVMYSRYGRKQNGIRFAFRMSKSRSKTASLPLDVLFAGKPRKPIPHEFVLDALAPLSPTTRPMFGCLAIYVKDKIVLILRNKDKRDQTADNGVWLATTEEHHQSLRQDFPNMRSIKVLGKKVTGWQVLPTDAEDFEEAAQRACELVLAGDPRIGKVPGARRPSRSGAKKAAKGRKR